MLMGTGALSGTWTLGYYTGILPYYVDDSKKIYFLLGLYKVQHSNWKLYSNFRAAGSTIDDAAKIGVGKEHTNDVFWKTKEDLRKQLDPELSFVKPGSSDYSFYLVDVTSRVNALGGRDAVVSKFPKDFVIWIDAEDYKTKTKPGNYHTYLGKPISHYFFTQNDQKLDELLLKIKAQYPQKRLHNALEFLTEKIAELKALLKSLVP